MGHLCLSKYTLFSSEKKNIVLQWAFKSNSILGAAEIWYSKRVCSKD